MRKFILQYANTGSLKCQWSAEMRKWNKGVSAFPRAAHCPTVTWTFRVFFVLFFLFIFINWASCHIINTQKIIKQVTYETRRDRPHLLTICLFPISLKWGNDIIDFISRVPVHNQSDLMAINKWSRSWPHSISYKLLIIRDTVFPPDWALCDYGEEKTAFKQAERFGAFTNKIA